MDVNAYARQLKELLPPGLLFKLEEDSALSKMLLALSEELARVHTRAGDLVEEWDPRTASEMLEEWERILGLPDECVITIPTTTEERELAVTAKYATQGGQTKAYFIALAETLGYEITITEYSTSDTGEALCGEAVCAEYDVRLKWTVTVISSPDPSPSVLDIECVIRRAAPAHHVVDFIYL